MSADNTRGLATAVEASESEWQLADRGVCEVANRQPPSFVPDAPAANTADAGYLSSHTVALVHDYLNQRGGAERVVLELSQMFPHAPIYTSLYRPGSTFPGFRERDVRATMLDRLPVDRSFRNLFPLYPAAFLGLREIVADVVLASSSGWAHLARASPGALHAVYCHTPARWLYGGAYLKLNGRPSRRELAVRAIVGPLRYADRRGALRADLYIANSENVRRRIRSTYGVDAVVVPPPVDTTRFRPTPRGQGLLLITRLLPYKRADLVVRAATSLGMKLDVVGDGPLLPALREIAGPGVRFHRAPSDDAVAQLMAECSAVCVAAEEDFGIVAVEAQAAGKPVVAYGRGGSLETVKDGFSGVFFHEQTEESLVQALRAVERLDTPPEAIAARAERYSAAAFRMRIARVLAQALERRSGRAF